MRPSSLAIDLEDEAAAIRRLAAGIRASRRPIDVPWPPGGSKTLHQLTSIDLDDFASDLERDAEKLRNIYS
jgi:hypothetical protein